MINLVRPVVDLALPPRCPGCGTVTAADHRFCATCWGPLRFLARPWCAGCNTPFAYDRGEGARCAACLQHSPRHAGVLAAVTYGDVARTVALRLKYGGRTAFAETAARQMARLMPADAALLVPVPLHRWRLWSRGFNQAALMAQSMTRLTGVPTEPMLLRRTRATPMLRGLSARERAKAVAEVFALVPDAAAIQGSGAGGRHSHQRCHERRLYPAAAPRRRGQCHDIVLGARAGSGQRRLTILAPHHT